MSQKLIRLIEGYVARNGKNARTLLSAKAQISPTTLGKILNGHLPLMDVTYRIAIACGCGDEDALKLARESSYERAKTA